MKSSLEYALDAAKEITIARMGNTNISVNKGGGDLVADFYERIFIKVKELAQENDN